MTISRAIIPWIRRNSMFCSRRRRPYLIFDLSRKYTVADINLNDYSTSNVICYLRPTIGKLLQQLTRSIYISVQNMMTLTRAVERPNLIVAFVSHTLFGHIPHVHLGKCLCTCIACLYCAYARFHIIINRSWASMKSLGYIILKAELLRAASAFAVHVSDSW